MKRLSISLLAFAVCLAAFADEGDKGWICNGATFTIIGAEEQPTMTGFTSADGKVYNASKKDAYCLSLKPSANAGVIIDLGRRRPSSRRILCTCRLPTDRAYQENPHLPLTDTIIY